MNKIYNLYRENYNKLTKIEKKIAEYIAKNPKKVLILSALDLGKEIGVSDASILRFSKNIGFNKFIDFKNYIAVELSEGNLNDRVKKNWNNFNSENDIVNKIVNTDLKNIENFLYNIDLKQIEKIVKSIEKAKKIYFLGIGSSRGIAQFIYWHITRMGFNSENINEGGLGLYEKFFNIKKDELVIIFAFPKFLKDELNIIKFIKEKKANTILITSNIFSEISFLSDEVIKVPVQNNSFFNSYMVPIELCNIILTMLFEKNKERIYKKWTKYNCIKDFLFIQDN